MPNFQVDTLSNKPVSFKISEANSSGKVDGKHVLALVEGEFFVPDGESRNKRYYPKSLWQSVLNRPEVKEKLEGRNMFGTFGHDQPLDEIALLNGKISHIVTNLKINEDNKDIDEILVLDTTAGRILNTFLRAGSKLYVSSRADGAYVEGKQHNGMPIVDEKNYYLHGFDFVIDPGFLEANPKLVESLNKLETNTNEENFMALEKLLEKVSKENEELKERISANDETNESLRKQTEVLTEENSKLKEVAKENEELKATLKKYEDFGTLEECELFEKKYEELSKSEKELFEVVSAYEEYGTIEELKEFVEKTEILSVALKELGTIEEIKESVSVLEEISELGSIQEIKETFNLVEKMKNEQKEQKRKNEISDLAKELNVSEERIEKVYDKLSKEEITDLFIDLKKESVKENFRQTFTRPVIEDKNSQSDKPSKTQKSEGRRLIESLM